MAELRKVCMQGDIPEGEGMTVEIDGKMIAVFKCGEKEFRAIDDHCPHMGASLSGGYV